MNNQSPYMKAYEAGIKLAAHEFFGKFAKELTEEQKAEAAKFIADKDIFSPENSAKASKKLKEINPEFAAKYPGQGEEAMATAPAPQEAEPSFIDSLDSYRSYLPSLPTGQQAMDMVGDAGSNIMSGLGQAGDYISNMFGGGGATESAPLTPEEQSTITARNRDAGGFMGDIDPVSGESREALEYMAKNPQQPAQSPTAPTPTSRGFGTPSMTRDANRSFNIGGDLSLKMDNFALPTPQAPAPSAAPQRFTEEDRLAINQQNAMAGMEPLMAEPSPSSELARRPNFPSIRGAKALNQAAAQRAQGRRDEAEIDNLLEDDAARGNVEDDQMFGAVRGGYGKQLKALRGMGGLSQDARDLLGQTNYRQLASAMGNRGLRVGDQFSVQDLLGRLRGQQARRDQGASSGEAIGSKSSPISIQNRRGSTVNRGALRQRPQRTAAPQASAPRPNVRSMVNQLGIKPNQPLNLGPAPSQADLLRSVGAPQAPAAPKPQQGLMSGLQDFPSNIGSF